MGESWPPLCALSGHVLERRRGVGVVYGGAEGRTGVIGEAYGGIDRKGVWWCRGAYWGTDRRVYG
eukprot:770665-Rhodomonas_salina.1